MSRVAVGSTDGVVIDEHFGKAEFFYIYEVDEYGGHDLIEKRFVQGGPQQVAEMLADVKVVLVKQLGPHAEEELRKRKIIGLKIEGSLERALNAYAKRGKLINYFEEELLGYAAASFAEENERAVCPLRALKNLDADQKFIH
jgi:nitrogen fixation protein NifB